MTSINRQSEPNYKTAAEWHRYWVYHDPEFIRDLYSDLFDGTERPEGYYQARYYISHNDVHTFVIQGTDDKPANLSVRKLDHLPDERIIVVGFSESVTKEEYEKAWHVFKWYREKRLAIFPTHKRKPPENTKLIYAIFKARNPARPKTFSRIFKEYKQGSLPYYIDGPSSSFNTQEELERYYYRHRPIIPS